MVTDLMLGIQEQYKPLVIALCSLPCFTKQDITKVTVINSGLSQSCFRVQVDRNEYFAKHITSGNTEIFANQLATQFGISPTVIYEEEEWLITEFIHGELLQHDNISEDEQLTVLLSLLIKCHRLPILATAENNEQGKTEPLNAALTIPNLAIEQTISQLFQRLSQEQQRADKTYLSLAQVNSLKEITKSALEEVRKIRKKAGQSNDVFCHGDANFSNVIKQENSNNTSVEPHYQLIDFECACIAPIEYELAMLMAVNEFQSNKTEQITTLYSELSSLSNIEFNPYSSLKNTELNRPVNRNLQPPKTAKSTIEIVDNLAGNATDSGCIDNHLVTRYYDLSLVINALWYFCRFNQHKHKKYQKLANKQFSLLTKHYPETSIVIK